MNNLRKNNNSSKGFTIIEVVLVLAIAGLIFLMVFIALPALQRGQRDAGRKNDVSTVVSALQTYLSNNRGSFTGLNSAGLQKYIDKLGQYDATDITVYPSGSAAVAATDKTIQVYLSQECPSSMPAPGTYTPTLPGNAGARQAAVFTLLENNGSSTAEQLFCQDL